MFQIILPLILTGSLMTNSIQATHAYPFETRDELSSHTIKLDERVLGGGYVSSVMSDNILLTLSYMNKEVKDPKNINWDDIRRSRMLSFRLNKGETFAFHEDVLPKFEGSVIKTTNSHFNLGEGFRYDGYLPGDGVCHLASLLNQVAKDSGLKVVSPTNHDFMAIPGVPKEYGTSIYYYPSSKSANALQNLYIQNTYDFPILFKFQVDGSELRTTVFKID